MEIDKLLIERLETLKQHGYPLADIILLGKNIRPQIKSLQLIDEVYIGINNRKDKIRPGRIFYNLLNQAELKKLSLEDIQQFSIGFQSFRSNVRLVVLKGEALREAFAEYNNYIDFDGVSMVQKGTLYKSCMKYGFRQDQLDLYVQNPDAVSLLVAYKKSYEDIELVAARALLWNDIETQEPLIMDRIYYFDEFYVPMFVMWADKHSYAHKSEQSSIGRTEWILNGKFVAPKYLKLRHHVFPSYPYLDTFKYYIPRKGEFWSVPPMLPPLDFYEVLQWDMKDEISDGTLSQSGELKYHWYDKNKHKNVAFNTTVFCEREKIYADIEDTTNIDGIISDIANCLYSDFEKKLIHQHDAVLSKLVNSWISRSNAVYSHHRKDFIPKQYAMYNVQQNDYFIGV